MEMQKRLLIKKSTLPGAGKGLFAKQFIEKGSLITEYTGDITTWKKIQENETFNGYVFYLTRNHVIDAMLDLTAIGRYANDARGATKVRGLKNNAEYAIKNKKVFIRAITDIKNGDEILVDYGKEYWDVIKYNQSLDTASKKTVSKNGLKICYLIGIKTNDMPGPKPEIEPQPPTQPTQPPVVR